MHVQAIYVGVFATVAFSASLCAGPSCSFPESRADKNQYHLFNPTPRNMLRDLSTDRPDKTESPFTVDAGHVQIEADLASYTHDRHNVEHSDERVDALGIATMNLKLGLLNNVDLQVVIESFTYESTRDNTTRSRVVRQGFGDITTRLKINLWGNDGGPTALALMPYVKWPTNQNELGNDALEGGLIVPLAVELPGEWGMGIMTQFDLLEDGDGQGHHVEFVNTITFSHAIVGELSGYVEFFSAVSTEPGADWIGTFDCGLTYAMTPDIQLDGGINIGLTRSADDFNPFIGITCRF